ncbi:hypothetical protein [Haladaptatus sp. DJG-WS-42]|uniref:hypothetical protein n=1 Tax=Haladaptatus sp. DJG-WS-42 TaxID=3120516 RepID=UPI0030CD73AD
MASSPAQPTVRESDQDRALLAGLAVGVGALSLFVLVGFLFAEWSLTDALSHASPSTVGFLFIGGAFIVAVFAVPITAYLGWKLVVPAVLFAVIVVFWGALAFSVPVANASTVTGLVAFALLYSPVYLILYSLGGGLEYYVHTRSA